MSDQKVKGIFEKGYMPNWSEEIFKIKEVLMTKPITYKIVDLMEDEVKGSFYEQELQPTKQDENIMFVEKELKKFLFRMLDPSKYKGKIK